MESRLVSLLLGELELAPIGNLHLPMPATRADTLRDGELIDVTKGSRLGDPGRRRRRRRRLGRLRGTAGN